MATLFGSSFKAFVLRCQNSGSLLNCLTMALVTHFEAVMVYVTKKDNNVHDVHCFSAGVWADFFILIIFFSCVFICVCVCVCVCEGERERDRESAQQPNK